MRKYYGNKILKLTAWLLLSLSLAGTMFYGYAALMNYAALRSDDFFESASIKGNVRTLAFSALWEGYETGSISLFAGDNVSFRIFQYENGTKSGRIESPVQITDSDHVYVFDYLIEEDSLQSELEETDDLNSIPVFLREANGEPDQKQAGKIAVYVRTPEQKNDEFYMQYQTFLFIRQYRTQCIPLLILSLAVWLLSAVYLISAAGHKDETDVISLNAFDRIPPEIKLFILAALAAGVFGFYEDISYSLYNFVNLNESPGILVIAGICSVLAFLILFTIILSFVRRIKAHCLFETSLIVILAKNLLAVIRMIPDTWIISVCAAFMFFLNVIAILFAARSMFHPLVALLDFACCIAVIAFAYYTKKLKEKTSLLKEGVTDLSAVTGEEKLVPSFYRNINEDLMQISSGIETAVEKQMKSERLKTELITNVSHDIRTPLTSVINYTDLLSKESDPEKQKEYLEALRRNGERLKKLSEDLIEASKASTGNIHAEMSDVSLREIIDQSLGEYEEKLSAAHLTPVVTLPEEEIIVRADGRLLWRVFSNLLSNCVKYAQPETRVYIDAVPLENNRVRVIMKNISRDRLNISSDELMERFVRGDSSRNSEGSGLGLNIVQSLCRIMNGSFEVTVDGDLFKAEIILSKAN
ncbi:MAG: HAMP domain-containing sensor histidine kinase [Erysipelotrichaceae bacterium]|nr:HAMP domain-containing sensor histidine kinase [Erysipelotrichaceae bacterium]